MKTSRNPFLALLVTCAFGISQASAADITLLQSDPTGTNSFTSAGNWSNSAAPSAGNDYFVTGDGTTFNLRAPANATFAGDSLTINNGGILAWAPSSNTGTLTVSNLILNGGGVANFRTSGTLTLEGNVDVTAASALRLGSGANTSVRNITLNSTVTGNGQLEMLAQNNSVSTLTVNGNNSTFTGGFLLSGNVAESDNSVLTVGHVNALGSGTTTVDQGTLNLNGFSVSIGGLAGTPSEGADSFVQNNSDTAATLTVNSSGDTSYAGVIRNGSGTGNLGLNKSGSGTLTLSGVNTYTGDTVVSAGTLFVNGSLGNSAVTVDPLATIGGTGTINGDLTFAANSFLEVIDFDNPLAIAGTATFESGFGIANLLGIDWDSLDLNTAYTLISTSQAFEAGDIANFGFDNRVSVGSLGREAYFTDGSLALVVIPEPRAALLGGLGLLMLLRRRRS